MRFFNTAGPCDPRFHYMVPAAERLPQAPRLVAQGAYFVVHAPRQTGKTTTLSALAQQLTAQGRYAALHFSCETGEVAGDDYAEAQRAVLDSIHMRALLDLPAELRPPDTWPTATGTRLLSAGLHAWAQACPRPLVLFFDEIDALRGQSLMAVLRQLRAAYQVRPRGAPWSVVLCGLRDVRDYKDASGGDPDRLGTSSPFNIKVESLRLGDFDEAEVAALYGQHTRETGQPFTDESLARAHALTRGQPWLVNALAREVIEEMGIAPPTPITAEHVDTAKERLILARATHLDSLVARLGEPRVRRIVEPLMAGMSIDSSSYSDDVSYARDMGLIAPGRGVEMANPIYREVIARVLAESVENQVQARAQRFLQADGRLDMEQILRGFADFWCQHGEVLAGALLYHEVAPQLVLMAYMQSLVNGTGFIDREYGVGRGRIDLQVRWPYAGERGARRWQREAIELKVWRDKQADPLEEGLAQLDGYLDRLGLDRGALVIFDRRRDAASIAARTHLAMDVTPAGRAVVLLRA
jgi:hypothetical protein